MFPYAELHKDEWSGDDLHEECGVFGVYSPKPDAARLAYFSIYALQHRGQEGAGIVSCDGHTAHIHKGMGLVSQVFNEANLSHLRGHLAIGMFDGVHLGHRAVVEAAAVSARQAHGIAAALTFDPHPSRLLRPDKAVPLLLSADIIVIPDGEII